MKRQPNGLPVKISKRLNVSFLILPVFAIEAARYPGGGDAAMVGALEDIGGGAGDDPRCGIQRVVEMDDAHCFAEDLDGVEIAIGIEGVAGVVGGDGGRDACG